MKKIVVIGGLFVFLAAGCGSSQTSLDKEPVSSGQTAVNVSSTAPKPSAEASKVSGADGAVNLLEGHSSSEQSIVAGTDDSDLATPDTQELNSLMEVPNE